MFQGYLMKGWSLSSQLTSNKERNRGRRLKGQEKLAHTLELCHTVMQTLCVNSGRTTPD